MNFIKVASSMMMIVVWQFVLASTTSGQVSAPPPGSIDVLQLGARADGQTDDTAAIQKALDLAGKRGGVVRLPAGRFLVAGSLRIPVGAALVGTNQAPVYIEPLIGTVSLPRQELPIAFQLLLW